MTATKITTDLTGPLANSLVAVSALISTIAYLFSTSPKLRRMAHDTALTTLRGFAYAVGYFTIALAIVPIMILYYVDMHWDSISPWNLICRRPTDVVMLPAAPVKKTRRSDSVDSNISALDLGESVIQDSEDDSAVDLSLGDERVLTIGEGLHQA